MSKINIDIVRKKDNEKRLKDINSILKIAVTLAYQKKDKAFYEIIAKELVDVFDNNLLGDIKLKKFNDSFYRINLADDSLLFLKSNIFNDELITVEEFLNQKLVKKEVQDLPPFISNEEKNEIMNSIEDSREVMNSSYGRQQLNSDNFILNLVPEDEQGLKYIFDKMGYYSINVLDYIKIISDNYDYENAYIDNNMKLFKNTFNSYIIELGVYISKVIDEIETR